MCSLSNTLLLPRRAPAPSSSCRCITSVHKIPYSHFEAPFSQADLSFARAGLQNEVDKCLQLQRQGECLAAQAADASDAAAASERRAVDAERRLQGVVDEVNMRWLLKWKSKMPLELPEASSPLDIVPEALSTAAPSMVARSLLVSELRRTFSFFSLFLNAYRDRVAAAAKSSDTTKPHGKAGSACGKKLLLQCSKEHSKVMESVVGSVSRLVACIAIVMGDVQSPTLHDSDLLQSILDSSSSISSALHKWSRFAHELSVCMTMLLQEEAADQRAGSGSGPSSTAAAARELTIWHRSLASLTSIAREVT
jgi:hypothetical protein